MPQWMAVLSTVMNLLVLLVLASFLSIYGVLSKLKELLVLPSLSRSYLISPSPEFRSERPSSSGDFCPFVSGSLFLFRQLCRCDFMSSDILCTSGLWRIAKFVW